MEKEERKRKMAQAWCDFQERMMLSNGGCGPMVLAAVVVVCVWLMWGCRQVEYVAVPQQHTEHHWHTDSVHTTDSVITEKETTIMQLDSAEMAKYGIQLKNAERAWLVKTRELERQIQQLMQLTQTKDSVHDTIPMPYPVEVVKEVEKDLSWWQQTRMHIGGVVLWLIGIAAVVWLIKKYGKKFLHMP